MRTSILPVCASMILAMPGMAAAEPSCGAETYFAPTDYYKQAPLASPHDELRARLKLARGGNALEQRNLAIAYEVGYLVRACPARSRYWYRKAAAGGDAVAKDRVATAAFFAAMRNGPECADLTCPVPPGAVPATLQLQPGAGGAFHVPVTINGVTVSGLIDTGASLVSLTSAAAKQMGIASENGRRVTLMTANGTKEGTLVYLDKVTVGGITLTGVQGVVSEGAHPVLVGMSFLSRLNVSVTGGAMTLTRGRVESAVPPSESVEED
jgi:clan AA aspartic protease (TIGR02281 family)